jgi:transcriptional regulator with XRE-family HTH domain
MLTQAQLAASAGVPQPSVSRIETSGSATVELVSRLLGALGLRLVAAPLDRPTVAESALAIRGQVAAGAPGTPAFRLLLSRTESSALLDWRTTWDSEKVASA